MARDLALPDHNHCSALTGLVSLDAARLAGRAGTHTARPGEMIYAMGDATDHLYLVRRGRVRTSILSPNGRELVVGIYGPGEIFGELCFCEIRSRQEQAVAMEETTLARLGVDDLVTATAGSESCVVDLLKLFCHRMAEVNEQLAELAFASVRARLGLLLLRLAEGGIPGPDGAVTCRESPTHEEMAARVSTTREQVTAILSRLREEGLVGYRRNSPIRVFPERLAASLEKS